MVLVAASYLALSDKQEWNAAWRLSDGIVELIFAFADILKCYNAITSIEANLFPP